MNIFYIPELTKSSKQITFNEEESKHACRVLRLKSGDKIQLVNGKGLEALCTILDDNPKKCTVAVDETKFYETDQKEIHIAVAPTKNIDRTEWFVEKATEIGITEITFIFSKNSERKVIKLDRIQKILVSAMKQSKRKYLPILNEPLSIQDFFKKHQKGAIAHCFENEKKSLTSVFKTNNYPILIGPEGDFNIQEIEIAKKNNFDFITLGENRLRTETAALYACMEAKLI